MFVCCFAAAATMLNLVDQQLTLRNVKNQRYRSLVIGTGARSEDAAAAAASNLVGLRESSVLWNFPNCTSSVSLKDFVM